jgi:hypothetical protein
VAAQNVTPAVDPAASDDSNTSTQLTELLIASAATTDPILIQPVSQLSAKMANFFLTHKFGLL